MKKDLWTIVEIGDYKLVMPSDKLEEWKSNMKSYCEEIEKLERKLMFGDIDNI